MIENLRSLGCTVLLTTHYMDEAQQLADRIAVIAAGKIVARGTAEELAHQVRAQTSISWVGPEPVGLEMPVVIGADGRHSLQVDERDVVAAVHAITNWAVSTGHELGGFEVTRPDLEQTYLHLVDAATASQAGTTGSQAGTTAS